MVAQCRFRARQQSRQDEIVGRCKQKEFPARRGDAGRDGGKRTAVGVVADEPDAIVAPAEVGNDGGAVVG